MNHTIKKIRYRTSRVKNFVLSSYTRTRFGFSICPPGFVVLRFFFFPICYPYSLSLSLKGTAPECQDKSRSRARVKSRLTHIDAVFHHHMRAIYSSLHTKKPGYKPGLSVRKNSRFVYFAEVQGSQSYPHSSPWYGVL